MARTQPPTGPRLRPEDWLLYEALCIARGEKPRSSVRFNYAGYDAARKRGGSVNHADLAAGAKSGAGETKGPEIEYQCDERTDFGLCEPWSRNDYGRWSFSGKLLHYRRHKTSAAAAWCRHFVAGLILMSTYPTDERRNIVGMPGARSGKRGFHAIGWPEWLVAYSRGVDDPKLRRKANGQRTGPDAVWPEDYSTALLDALEPEIREIAEPVWQALYREGWPGVLRFYCYGTRVGHRIRRTDAYLAAVLEQNPNANTPPTWAFLHFFNGATYWHPDTDQRIRQQHDGGHAQITSDLIAADSEFFGIFTKSLPQSPLVYDVRSHSAGVTVNLAHVDAPKPSEPVTVYEPPPKRKGKGIGCAAAAALGAAVLFLGACFR